MLATRLRVAAGSQALLTPLSTEPEPVGGRWRTRWPYVETVVPQPEYAPWAEAGRLLAQLHREVHTTVPSGSLLVSPAPEMF